MKRLKDFLLKENAPANSQEDFSFTPEELFEHLDIQKRGKVDITDYAAHVLFFANHPEYLNKLAESLNETQKRYVNGSHSVDAIFKKLEEQKTLYTTEKIAESKSVKDSDPPAVLIMRRKSIRQFPNGQRVALYYVDKLDKFITVPYEHMQWTTESAVLDTLIRSVKNNSVALIEHLDGTSSEITPEMAENIIDLYKKINETNKQKMLDMLEASEKHFQTIAKFSKE